MRRESPIEVDEDLVDDICEMKQGAVVALWNKCLDELANKPKVWKRVERSMEAYKLPAITPGTVLYANTAEGWEQFLLQRDAKASAEILSKSSETWEGGCWFFYVLDGLIVCHDEDEIGIAYPLAIFMRALGRKL